MLRALGFILIFVSGSGMGFRAAYELQLRIYQIKRVQGILTHVKGELRYSHQPISVILKNAALKTEVPFLQILQEAAESLELHNGNSFSEIWEESIIKYGDKIYLAKDEIQMLKNFGNITGMYDKQLQINQIELQLAQWEQKRRELEEAVKENVKLYRCLGIMGSILVIIILL